METGIVAHLSGVLTPELTSAIQQPERIAITLSFAMCALALVFFLMFISWVGKQIFPKSLEYRKLLTDMYIVGMIKKFAEDDKVDVMEELKIFSKIEKKKGLSYKDIDSVIADNLRDKIDAKNTKEIENIEKD